MNNMCFFWGGIDVIPLTIVYDSIGMCYNKGNELLERIPDDCYGEANYTRVEERDVHILIGKSYKHLFDSTSDKQILCVDKTIVSLLFLTLMDSMFKIKGLRIVK